MFPDVPWFAACAPGSVDVRGQPATGCMTRARQDAMAVFRLRYQEWREAVLRSCR